jgi:hypothetical protein
MHFQRSPPEHTGQFMSRLVLPEIASRTLEELSKGRQYVRVWCTACDRDSIFTPYWLAELFPTKLTMSVEDFALAAKCATCGAQEAQVSGWAAETYDPRPMFVRREHHGVPLRRNG